MDHQSQNSHLSRTTIVELDGTLALLAFFAQLVPAKVEGTVAVVTGEFCLAAHVTVEHFGQLDVLVNTAAQQFMETDLRDITVSITLQVDFSIVESE